MATVLTVAATQIASLVDASLVGQLIGSEALGAVNISKPILQLSFSIGNLFIIGSSILAGMAIGAGDRGKANRIFTRCLLMVSVAGLLIVLIGQVWFEDILNLMCNSDRLRPMAGEYMKISLASMFPFLWSYMLETYVIVDGAPKLATVAVVISNLTNIVLDVLFINVFHWGVAGAASATLMMYVLSVLILLTHFIRKDSNQKVLGIDCRRENGLEGKMIVMGLPVTMTTFLIAVQIACCNRISIKYLGDEGVVAFAVCIALLAFSMIFVAGSMRTIQPVGAILKGMDDSRGILLMMGRAYRFLVVCLIVLSAILILAPQMVATLFGANDASTWPVLLKALPPFTLYIVMEGMFSLLIPAYQFYAHTHLAMFVALSKAVFPMIGFWFMAAFVPEGAWWGFFLGMVVVGVVILIITVPLSTKKRNGKRLSPILLIPLQSEAEVFDISIPAKLEEINTASDGIMVFLRSNGMSERTCNYTALCVEELVKNIAVHSDAHFVDVRAMVRDGKAAVSLHDDGVAFNPVDISDKDKIGLSLVRKIVSNIKYEYLFNQNMVNIEVRDA